MSATTTATTATGKLCLLLLWPLLVLVLVLVLLLLLPPPPPAGAQVGLPLCLAAAQVPGECARQFDPASRSPALRTAYKLETFVTYNLDSITDLQEEYQYQLASARVDLRRQYSSDTTGGQVFHRVYLYDGLNRRDVELEGSDKRDGGGFHLEENGGSSSYGTGRSDGPAQVKVRAESSLDDVLFRWNAPAQSMDADADDPQKAPARLNLDSFLGESCRKQVEAGLKHVRGLTKILHLIECRADEFSLDSHWTADGAERRPSTRGVEKLIYRATNLDIQQDRQCDDCVKYLNMTVSIIDRSPSRPGARLPSRALPTSLSVEFGAITMIINVFQLETLAPDAHLSESGTSLSSFTMPLASHMSNLLFYKSARNSRPSPAGPRRAQFSFQAKLSSSPDRLADAAELTVAYDSSTQRLARQLSLLDANLAVEGDSVRRHTTRMLYDGRAQIKYHVALNNNDYVRGSDQDTGGEEFWSECASDALAAHEELALESGAPSEAFELEGAVYLGTALVRGVPCFVYERPLYRMPIWMGFGLFESTNLDEPMNRIQATIYVAAERLPANISEHLNPLGDALGDYRLLRLVLTVTLNDEASGETPGAVGPKSTRRLTHSLEVFAFERSTNLASDLLPGLFQVDQECLLSRLEARYLRLGAQFKLKTTETGESTSDLVARLAQEDQLRAQLVSRALVSSLGIAASQQAQLETHFQGLEQSLEASLLVYEVPNIGVNLHFIGYARDLSLGSAKTGGWSVGATSMTMNECQWRALHTLKLPVGLSACNHHRDCHRLFMYCPATLHCVLSDENEPKWSQLEKTLELIKIDFVLSFPERHNHPNRCALFSVELYRQDKHQATQSPDQSAPLDLDSLIARRDSLQDLSPIQLYLDPEEATSQKLTLHVSELALSNVINPQEGNSPLGEPLQGLAYEPPYTMEPLKVASVAHCGRACLVDHRCSSYSVCHHPKLHLECLLARVNWTEPDRVAQARELAHSRLGLAGSKRGVDLQVQLEDGQSVDLSLKRSSLCSIHASQHLDIFKSVASEGSTGIVSEAGNMLSANSSEECARFCLSRAQLLLQVEASNNLSSSNDDVKAREKSKISKSQIRQTKLCTSFKFNWQLRVCQLLPGQELESLQEQLAAVVGGDSVSQPGEAKLLISKWQHSLQMATESKGNSLRYIEFESTYELDYEQLFVAQADRKLTVLQTDSRGTQLQASLFNTGFRQCAKLCLERFTCRSFDVLSQSVASDSLIGLNLNSGPRMETCILNAFSIDDINSQTSANISVETKLSDSTSSAQQDTDRWWHYEFNELALYATGKLAPEGENEASQSIFIRPTERRKSANSLLIPERESSQAAKQTHSSSANFWLLILALLACLLLVGGLLKSKYKRLR